MKKTEVILGLGSNVGDKRQMLSSAIAELSKYLKNISVSSIYESPALLPEGAPPEWNIPFYNMAIAGKTSLSPRELLNVAKQIEQQLGRNKIGHWSPREIDIDILAMENLLIDEADLSVPHKELLKRGFALVPLAEIAPDWVHPLERKTTSELLSYLPKTSIKKLPKPKLVGIINITPDSFSDGGKNFTPQTALKAINQLVEDGADIIDIGAESTRPNATPISQEEEWARLEPVLSAIKNHKIPISIDTRHAKTAQQALKLGVGWINDVSGFSNPEMIAAVRDSTCKLVVMHSLSVPADKNIILPLDEDPIELIIAWAITRFVELEKAGIKRDRIIFDAGIGFGKNAQQSMTIINGIARFKLFGVPILIGHSRKSFLQSYNPVIPSETRNLCNITKTRSLTYVRDDKENIDDATIKISQFLSENGVDYLRVHNIRRHKLEVL